VTADQADHGRSGMRGQLQLTAELDHMMRRPFIVTFAVAAGAVSAAAIFQGPPDTRAVKLQTLNVRDILYILTGGGGNALALMRDEGVVLIDAKTRGSARGMLDAVQAVTDKPVTMIINTHAHADHTAGNVEFASATEIVAHDNTKAVMARMDAFAGPNAKFLPTRTFRDRLTLLDGLDRMDLYYFGAGHTNGDIVVVFPEKHLAHLGDLFPSKSAPVIDAASGGSGVAFPDTLAKLVNEVKGVTRVTTGHDERSLVPRDAQSASAIFANPQTMTWDDLKEYADFNRDFLEAVRAAIKDGKSAEQAAATLQLPARYKDYDMQRAAANVATIYRELGK
jgi:glyoxylase-like metal-dependent hydrolase (beta-lactamase superfamily II)